MTQAGISERRLGSVGELTAERLAELRRVAEAVTPGPWAVNPFKATVDEMPSMLPICGLLWPTDQRTEEQTLANATHIATFDPTTVLSLLGEIERLRRERETLAAAVRAREEARRAAISPYRPSSEPVSETLRLERLHSEACKRDEAAHQKALALLDGEKGGDRRE